MKQVGVTSQCELTKLSGASMWPLAEAAETETLFSADVLKM